MFMTLCISPHITCLSSILASCLLFKWQVSHKRRISQVLLPYQHYSGVANKQLGQPVKEKSFALLSVDELCLKYCEEPDRNSPLLGCDVTLWLSPLREESGHLSRLALVRTAAAVTRTVIAWENRCLYVRPCACMSMERWCARAQPCVLQSVRACATWSPKRAGNWAMTQAREGALRLRRDSIGNPAKLRLSFNQVKIMS